jgi:hypothetical protein
MVFLLEFGAPENLVLIWLVPLVVLVCFFAEKIRKKRLRLVGIIREEPLGKHAAPTSFFRSSLINRFSPRFVSFAHSQRVNQLNELLKVRNGS